MDNSITNDAFCATIGFFDGVHRGHQFVIDRLKQTAKDGGMKSMVITFDLHPRQVVHASYVPQLLTSTDTKLQLLKATGVDRVEVLHFDLQMAQLSAKEFMQQVLHDRLGVRRLLIGYDATTVPRASTNMPPMARRWASTCCSTPQWMSTACVCRRRWYAVCLPRAMWRRLAAASDVPTA